MRDRIVDNMASETRDRPKRRRSLLALITLLVLAALLMVSCEYGECRPCPSAVAPPLHLPGVTRVSALSPILDAAAKKYPFDFVELAGITAFRDDSGTIFALATVHSAVYAVDVSRAHVAQVDGLTCTSAVALAPDRVHLVCMNAVENSSACSTYFCTILTLAEVSATWPPVVSSQQHYTIPGDDSGGYVASPVWMPDGRAVMMMERSGSDECSLVLFALSDSGTALTAAGRLVLDDKSTCAVRQLIWSPGGGILALLEQSESTDYVYTLDRRNIPLSVFRTGEHPDIATVHARLLGGTLAYQAGLSWGSDEHELIALTGGQAQLFQRISIATGARTTLLTLPTLNDGNVTAFTWIGSSGDDGSLLFGFRPAAQWPKTARGNQISGWASHTMVCGGCPRPPAVLYWLSPPISPERRLAAQPVT